MDSEKTWGKIKQEWKKKIEDLEIPEDNISQLIHYYEHEIDKVYQEASFHYSYLKTKYENINDRIKAIRKANGDQGNNKEEREAHAYKMLLYYPTGNPEDEDTKNLIKIRNNIREKYYFFKDYVMDNLKEKTYRLSTNVGASKVQAQIETKYGAN